MKILKSSFFLMAGLTVLSICVFNTVAQNSSSIHQTVPTQIENALPTNQVAPMQAENTALVIVADTSPSVKRQLDEIKARGRELVAAAPLETRVGIVGINWEASKKLFASALEANEFINSLTTGGKYTDLNRGNDAAMSLLQEAASRRAVVVFLTDGELEVPTGFTNRETFIEMLRREYTARPDVRVFVLNVKGKPLTGSETLPPNVTAISLADWQAAREIIAESLAPQIRAQLAPLPQPTATSMPEVTTSQTTPNRIRTLIYVTVGFIAIGAISFYLWLSRRRRRVEGESETVEPENILREEDLTPVVEPDTKPEPLLILRAAQRDDAMKSFASSHAVLRAGERLIIGKSKHLSGFALPELKQSQTLEIAFDGVKTEVFRLRPSAGEMLDTTRVDDADAPIRFAPRVGERIDVGVYEIELLLADEDTLSLYDTLPRTDAAIVNPSPENAAQRLRGGRLRRSSM